MPASRWDMGCGLARSTRACAHTRIRVRVVGVACPKGRQAVPRGDVPTVGNVLLTALPKL